MLISWLFPKLKDYLDATLGFLITQLILNCSTAAALGASVIEKHITLNNLLKGPDHKASLNPSNFKF